MSFPSFKLKRRGFAGRYFLAAVILVLGAAGAIAVLKRSSLTTGDSHAAHSNGA